MSRIIKIPEEYLSDFKADPTLAWHQYGDSPQEAEYPYFENRRSLHEMVSVERLNPFDDEAFRFDAGFVCEDDNLRFLHLDYSLNRDALGVAMCHVSEWVKVSTRYTDAEGSFQRTEDQPVFKFDFVARIVPKSGEDIEYAKIREILYMVNDLGFPIQLITFDRFQSEDSIQILRRKGFTCAHLSLDRTSNYPVIAVGEKNGFKKISTGSSKWSTLAAWSCFKTAVNTGRVDIPFYQPVSDTILDNHGREVNYDDIGNKIRNADYITQVEREALGASLDTKKMKIVEPPKGSIDLLEAVAGACFNANNNVTEIPVVESGQERRSRLVKDYQQAQTGMEKEEVVAEIGHDDSFDAEDFDDRIDEW